jgi:hypothetical protein
MQTLKKNPLAHVLIAALLSWHLLWAASPTGFYLQEPHKEVKIQYHCIQDLIVVPVIINNNISVNLVVDTGTRNIVLFGKRFQNLFQFVPGRNVRFSGMGSGIPVNGKLSLSNRVELTSLIGEQIPIVVVPNKNIFAFSSRIDGIIGYEVFTRFEVEINPRHKSITFRPALSGYVPPGFVQIPMRIENTKPLVDTKILLQDGAILNTSLMIDTGSQLTVLLKTTDNRLLHEQVTKVLGRGMSGNIHGISAYSTSVDLNGISFQDQTIGIIQSEWHNYGSIGMGLLKEYIIIINYLGAYACLKKLS